MSEAYKNAGVDVEAGYRSVELIKEHVKRTNIPGVLSGIGGFGGLFELGGEYKNPVLVSGTDGVGTKLKLAFIMDKHETVGQDCVAMCVNDIVCGGAKPLFFLDYIACGKNEPEKIARIVSGVADGCRQADSALIGGETAEMPGFYPIDEYDLAGFSVGIVDKKDMITGKDLKAGDVLVGMASSGIHSNGYSLVRSVFSMKEETLNQKYESLESDLTLGETLLTPTKIYVKALRQIKEAGVRIKACSHITGGGFYENVPRMLKDGQGVSIDLTTYPHKPIFDFIAKTGDIPMKEMCNVFNMGIGFMMAVDKADVEKVQSLLQEIGEESYVIGEVTDSGSVDLTW